MPCDDPRGAAVAKRVLKHFAATVRSSHPQGAATQHLLALLHAGVSEADLLSACDGYAEACRRNEAALNKRQGAGKFFSADGHHAQYLGWRPGADAPPPARNNLPPNLPEPGKAPGVSLKALEAERNHKETSNGT